MIGSTVSHYEILERLGSGGMGIVYKARDLKLDRLVALKFLAARGASEEEKRRFLREARTASQLDHPNICIIHEIDETADGELFITMALVSGESLRDRIERGPLPPAEAAGIAAQIAAGLAAAHAKGIIHRDVKPENVILTAGGQVKLVDFGVAKLADQSRLTRAGAAMGTVAYMSPEQLRGAAVDGRTDVWSLGVVLYEMLTGHHPFGDFADGAMARAILQVAPRSLRPVVSPQLAGIVTRALAKRPEDRYATIEELGADLRRVSETAGVPEVDDARTVVEVALPAAHSSGPVPAAGGSRSVGTTVGPYRIQELLGGGGMGVVYKAEDTRLSRTVALKFLPPELTRDAEAKDRFMQEARTASSLDHPNLCTILEAGETADGQLYLAMPCYDGETLRRKLERGPLPVDEAIEIGQQIARGLAKAHRNGIVHRDLKPANLIVTSDGVVKILDFGLAKLAGRAALSRTGSSAGTPAYMSPEQARGDEVDFRADLWSLGVILYEMLTGRRPFRGDREQAVIYALLNERPQPLRELRSEVPPELARIVDRLLEKNPADRYATIDGPLADLRALRGESLTGTAWIAHPSRRRFRPWLWATFGAVLAAGLAGYLWRGRTPAVPVPMQATFSQLTDQEGREWFPSISPDGGFFVYAKAASPGNLDLYLQRIGGGNPIDLTADSPVDDTQPAFSPDGQLIAFRSEREGGGIFLMGATGESVRRLTDSGYNPAWSPDGREIVVSTAGVTDPRARQAQGQLWRVEVGSGRRRPVRSQEDAVQPSWSPHRHRIAYWSLPPAGARREIWTVPAEGGTPVPITDDDHLNWSPTWSPDGRYLYFASDRGGSMNLWRVAIDEETGKVQGQPEPITTPAPWSGFPSLSRDGRRIVYATLEVSSKFERAALDPAGPKVAGSLAPVTQGSREITFGRVSPDGVWLVFYSSVPQEDLFVVRTDGTGLRQLTRDAFKDRNPNWSPDGREIAFYSDRSGRYEAWTIRPDGSGLRQVTATRGEPVYYPLWSPDRRRLACELGFTSPALIDLSRPLPERIVERLPPPPIAGAFFASSWSPDGRRLAGQIRDQGILVLSLESRRYERITPRGSNAIWFQDGRRLLFLQGSEVHVVDTRSRQSRRLLTPPEGSRFAGLDLGPDDRTLYLLRTQDEGDVWMLTAN